MQHHKAYPKHQNIKDQDKSAEKLIPEERDKTKQNKKRTLKIPNDRFREVESIPK